MMIDSAQTVAPVAPASVSQVKSNLRITTSDHDALLTRLIAAATARAERECGKAFGLQTWQARFDSFPALGSRPWLDLPVGPVVSILSISYLTADADAPVVVDPATYQTQTGASWVRPLVAWPTDQLAGSDVVVEYRAGRDVWPADVVQAIHLIVGAWFRNPDAVGPSTEAELPYAATALLGLHRRMMA